MKSAKRQSGWASLRHDIVTISIGVVFFVVGAAVPLPDVVRIVLMVLGLAIIVVVNGWF